MKTSDTMQIFYLLSNSAFSFGKGQWLLYGQCLNNKIAYFASKLPDNRKNIASVVLGDRYHIARTS